ncbi:MAG: hypothetical protein NWR42_08700, partial [Desulfobacterales bacterium]|nr:hypothetical protein [Desulfobacterales bacterium]
MRTIANPQPTQTGFLRQPEPSSRSDPGKPEVAYFLASDDRPVAENSPRWRMPLPLSPVGSARSSEPAAGAAVTYGDYFAAVHRFLEGEGFIALTGALRESLGQSMTAAD